LRSARSRRRTAACVEHAHQKGIIHRDLKPSNILVAIRGDRPSPKIIDFGVAKATTRSLTDRTLHTELGLIIGTLEYMSPEQAEMSGLDVDTRTDVYALGVILYELLTETLPFDHATLHDKPLDEVRRVIRELVPPRPSTRATAVAIGRASGREHAVARSAELRGDLDWITMRALEKDRTRRYGSVSELAAEVRRHLNHVPVLAGPPSGIYRARKFIRRHRLGVSVAAAAVVLMSVFAATMAIQVRRVAHERDRANREAEASNQISNFPVGLFRVSSPQAGRGSSVTARELLDEGAVKISRELAAQPEVRARMMSTMADAYLNLGLLDQATPLAEQSLAWRERALGEESRDTLKSINLMGALASTRGKLLDAEGLFRRALDAQRRALGPDDPDTVRSMANLGGVLIREGRYAEAEPYVPEGLERRRRVLGNDDKETLSSMNNLAVLLQLEGRFAESERLYRDALSVSQRANGQDHPTSLTLLLNLGLVLERQDKLAEAEPLVRTSLDRRRAVLGPDHPDTLSALSSLGNLLRRRGKAVEAEEYLRQAIDGRVRVNPTDFRVPYTRLDLARALNAQARYDDAEASAREGLRMLQSVPGSQYYGSGMSALGASLVGRKKLQDAEPFVVDGFDRLSRSSEVTSADLRDAAMIAVDLYTSWGKPDKAELWRARIK
jgi:non-specific serine/threonine protein kinase/serine/threonine-protein kinase